MRGPIHIRKVKMKYVVLLSMGLTQGLQALTAQMRIKFLLIRVEARREPYQRRG
jgi:hypothetical protein